MKDEGIIDAELERLLAKGVEPKSTLYEAAHYLLLAPGKRIRPKLCIAVAEMLGGEVKQAITAGCAIEMIHTYSLIHDDLPCMDDDDMRRGKPSMHKVYGEATAVLVGDFLLTYAFEVLAKHLDVKDAQKVKLISCLAECSGGHGMVAGQLLDINAKTTPIETVHSLKTAALFKASFAFGAIIANSKPTLFKIITAIGHEFGLLFQLVDDIADGDHLEGEEGALIKAEKKRDLIQKSLNAIPAEKKDILHLLDNLFHSISCKKIFITQVLD